MRWLPVFSILLPSLASKGLAAPAAIPSPDFGKSLSKRTISGVKINGANFPDPAIIFVDKWYAFATRTIGSSIRIQIATSVDFVNWSLVYNTDGSQRDALPNLPRWALQQTDSATWAPDVNVLDDGSFVMYYSVVVNEDTSKHCVGAATSPNILGPYLPRDEPLACPLAQGGAIDPAGFNDKDNGQRYMVYKVDGNSIGNGGACQNTVPPLVATPLILQPVSADGLTAQGSPITLLDHSGFADDGILEAPAIAKAGSTYVLFFSPGCFTTSNYKVAYATASSITGPYTRASVPLIKTGDGGLTAPGGADVTKDGTRIVYHANSGGGRGLFVTNIHVSGTSVSLAA